MYINYIIVVCISKYDSAFVYFYLKNPQLGLQFIFLFSPDGVCSKLSPQCTILDLQGDIGVSGRSCGGDNKNRDLVSKQGWQVPSLLKSHTRPLSTGLIFPYE